MRNRKVYGTPCAAIALAWFGSGLSGPAAPTSLRLGKLDCAASLLSRVLDAGDAARAGRFRFPPTSAHDLRILKACNKRAAGSSDIQRDASCPATTTVHCVYTPEVAPQYAALQRRIRRLGTTRLRCLHMDLERAIGVGAFGDGRWLAGTRAKISAAQRFLKRAGDGDAAVFIDLDVTLLCPSSPAALLECLGEGGQVSEERDICFMREPGTSLLNTGVIAWRTSGSVRRFFDDVARLLHDRVQHPHGYGSWLDLAAGDPPADGHAINRLLGALAGTWYWRPSRGCGEVCSSGRRVPLRWGTFSETVVAGGVRLQRSVASTLEVFHAHGVMQNAGKLAALEFAEIEFAQWELGIGRAHV